MDTCLLRVNNLVIDRNGFRFRFRFRLTVPKALSVSKDYKEMTFSNFPLFVFSFVDFSGNVGMLLILTYMWHTHVAVLTKNKGLIRPQMTVLEHIW